MKPNGMTWYDRIEVPDRIAVNALAKWLRPIPWQLFVTLTFPWHVRPETAVRKLWQFINQLERHCGCNVCVVAGQESKPRQHGIAVPTHFHLLLTSHTRLSMEEVEALWLAQVTRRPTEGRNVESVLVESYNAHQRGPEYCLKAMNDSHGDWLIHRLEHFLPGIPGPSKPNHRSLRSARRNRAQAARYKNNFDALLARQTA